MCNTDEVLVCFYVILGNRYCCGLKEVKWYSSAGVDSCNEWRIPGLPGEE